MTVIRRRKGRPKCEHLSAELSNSKNESDMVWYTPRKAIKFAAYSRIIVLVIQVIANYLLADHEPDVFNPPGVQEPVGSLDPAVELLLGGFRRWDSIYMLHIAEHGYTYENTVAFFPAFPLLVKGIGMSLLYPLQHLMTFRHVLMVSAFLLNFTCFLIAAWYLYHLSTILIGKGNRPLFSVLAFSFNPASIFMSAAYSETLFVMLTLALMYHVEKKQCVKATIALALATATRSNGVVLAGYPLYFLLKTLFTSDQYPRRIGMIRDWMKWFSCVLYGLLPFFVFQYMCYVVYCKGHVYRKAVPSLLIDYARDRGYHIPSDEPSQWCYHQIPYAYGYIQKHHWNVGLANYFELKQIPNFLLATPVVILSLYSVFDCITEFHISYKQSPSFRSWVKGKPMMYTPYLLHLLFLVLYGVFTVHIQILTRLIYSSSPLIYISVSKMLAKCTKTLQPSFPLKLIIWYHFLFIILGTIMHTNFYPWT